MRSVLLALAALGALLFGGAFAWSFVDGPFVERVARAAIQVEVERRVGARIDALSNARLVGLAQNALGKVDADSAATMRQIRDEVPQRVASVVADMLNADCECRKRLAAMAEKGARTQLRSLLDMRHRLVEFVEASYAEVAAKLLREFRVFTGANALVFVLLIAVTLFRRGAGAHLILPALVLIGSAAVTGFVYLFGQDWLHTILFNDYVGLGYFAYLAVAAALLADIALNRARVSTRVINQLASALGSSFQALPC
jgi:hypothetical protein